MRTYFWNGVNYVGNERDVRAVVRSHVVLGRWFGSWMTVLKVDRPISNETAERIREQWNHAMRSSNQLIILSEGMSIQQIHRTDRSFGPVDHCV